MKPIRESKLSIRQLLKFLFILILTGGVLYYALFQSRLLIAGPSITLQSEPATVQHARAVILEGMALNITSLFLNGKEIHTDETGKFKKTLVLEDGYTIMTLRAEDRYGRITELSRPFVYTP